MLHGLKNFSLTWWKRKERRYMLEGNGCISAKETINELFNMKV